jgi:hypothetical protein
MELLKNRKIAIVITVIVIILATLFGVNRSLNRLAKNVEAMFYDGIYLEDAGFTQPGISQHLSSIAQAALDITSAFTNHPELSAESDALVLARRELMDASSIAEKYVAYQGIQRSSSELLRKAETVDLSDRDIDVLSQFQTIFSGATRAIQDSQYNINARSFMESSSFIAYMLKPFLPVTAPQAFDV